MYAHTVVSRPLQLCDVWAHVTWSIANKIEVKLSGDQRCDVALKAGLTPMTQKSSSKKAILTYMELCSLKKEIKYIMTMT